jgi:hypothetical protein
MDHFLDHLGDAALFSAALTPAACAEFPARSTSAGPEVAVTPVVGVKCRARALQLVRYAPG